MPAEVQKEAAFNIGEIRSAAARITGRVVRTPVLASPMLDEAAGARVFVKAESLQLTGSFKIRGALNKVLGMSDEERRSGVAAYSAGNHAAAVAAAARIVGCPAVIVVPNTAPKIKVDNCLWWGAEVVFYDAATQDRVQVTQEIAEQRGMTIISPFDDYQVMGGAGTVGLEFSEQLQGMGERPDAVVVNCSGGGLASGVIEAMEQAFPGIEKYIVEPAGYDKMARSLAIGKVCSNPAVRHTIMDGISGPIAGEKPLEVLRKYSVQGLTVNDDEALNAVAEAYRTLKIVVEPGGAASLAAVLHKGAYFQGKTVAVVCSGGNVDPSTFARAIQGSFEN